MSNTLPKVPIRFVPQNAELLKGEYAGSRTGGTDYKFEHIDNTVSVQTIVPQYRTPADREAGWLLFKRYPNGDLDLQYAVQKVVDAIRNMTDGMTPNMFDQVMLACFYPGMFSHPHVMDGSNVLTTMLRISPDEQFQIVMGVHAHLHAMMVYSQSSHSI